MNEVKKNEAGWHVMSSWPFYVCVEKAFKDTPIYQVLRPQHPYILIYLNMLCWHIQPIKMINNNKCWFWFPCKIQYTLTNKTCFFFLFFNEPCCEKSLHANEKKNQFYFDRSVGFFDRQINWWKQKKWMGTKRFIYEKFITVKSDVLCSVFFFLTSLA